MKLKQRLAALLAAALLLGFAPAALAEAGSGCTIQASELSAGPGETVEVTVSLTGNPGFTNLAVALDYDREKLTLTALRPAEAEGLLTAVNPSWTGGEGESLGFLTLASAEALEEDMTLLTASFTVKEGASGEAAVTPQVVYMRDNTALFSVFEAKNAAAAAGKVSIRTAAAVLMGDINGDGKVNIVDAARTYAAVNGRYTLSEEQTQRVDVNGDGKINIVDAARVYAYINGRVESLG